MCAVKASGGRGGAFGGHGACRGAGPEAGGRCGAGPAGRGLAPRAPHSSRAAASARPERPLGCRGRGRKPLANWARRLGEAEGRSQTDASGLRRPPGARRPGRPVAVAVAVAGPARGGTRTAGRGPHGGDGPRPRRPPRHPHSSPAWRRSRRAGAGRGGAVPRQAAGRPRFSPGRRARGRVAAPAGLTAQKGGRLQAGGPRPLDAAPSGPHSRVLAPLTLSFCSPLKASRGCAHTSGFPASPGSFPKPGAGAAGRGLGASGAGTRPTPRVHTGARISPLP